MALIAATTTLQKLKLPPGLWTAVPSTLSIPGLWAGPAILTHYYVLLHTY